VAIMLPTGFATDLVCFWSRNYGHVCRTISQEMEIINGYSILYYVDVELPPEASCEDQNQCPIPKINDVIRSSFYLICSWYAFNATETQPSGNSRDLL